jgi:hypothetical protein
MVVMIVLNKHEVFLGDDHIIPIDLAKDIGRAHRLEILRQTGGFYSTSRSTWPNHIDIVCDQEHGQAQLLRRCAINSMTLCWVVISRPVVGSSQEDFRLLSQGTRNEYRCCCPPTDDRVLYLDARPCHVGEASGNAGLLFRSFEEALRRSGPS